VRVGVNLLWMVPGEVGGSETWMSGLLGHLAAHRTAHEVVLFAPDAVLEAHPELAPLEVVRAPDRVGPSRPFRVLAESTWLPLAARRAGVDVFHHPGGTLPSVRGRPAVLTVHDLQPLVMPENFAATKRAYLRTRLGPSVRKARVVTAVSEYTRDELRSRLEVPDARLMVTPPAIDPDPPPLAGAGPDEAGDVIDRFGLDRPWFLYPAITYPHKDHATLVRALAEVPDALLVLTGGEGPSESEVMALAADTGVADRVRRTGRIDLAALDALYRGAVACTFPSRFEGVGVPVLEAMARGCPVLAADATALPSVVGSAGELLPAGDPEAWAAAMTRLLADEARRTELVEAGRVRVARWSPDASVAKLVAAWDRAARPG
jgi:glycosyltransferase involved in cell wall biosynthesis